MRIIEVGIGVGFLAALGALVSIYPDPSHIYLKWLLFGVGSFIFLGCLVLEIYERIKANHLKAFISFLDKKIVEGQRLKDSKFESWCTMWGEEGKPIDHNIKDFEIHYKKWREEVYEGCKQVFGDKRELPYNEGQLPQLRAWSRLRCDYRNYLEGDIQTLKDFRAFTRREDVYKKLK